MYWRGDIAHIHYYVVTNRRQMDKYKKQSVDFSNTVGPVFTLSCEKKSNVSHEEIEQRQTDGCFVIDSIAHVIVDHGKV